MSQNTGLTVTFSNLQQAEGKLFVAVFNKAENFLQEDKALIKQVVPVTQTGELRINLGELPPGRYAISCFHDLNNNNKLDRNMLGIPTEPYGFSNNARPNFRAPNWDESQFEWTGKESFSIRLK